MLRQLLDTLAAITPDQKMITVYLLVYVTSLALTHILKSIQSVITDTVIQKAKFQYDCDIIEKLKKLPLSFIDSSKGKNIVEDVKRSQPTAVNVCYRVINILTSSYTFAVAIASLVQFNILGTFLFLALTIPGIVVGLTYDKKSDELKRKKAPDVRKFRYYRWMLVDAWPAKDVRMYDLTDHIKKRYDEEKTDYLEVNKRLDKSRFCASTLIGLLSCIGEIAFVVLVIVRAFATEITIGEVALYTGLSVSASSAFKNMISLFISGYALATAKMKRVFDFLEMSCADRKSGDRRLKEFVSLSFDNVYFKYPYTEKQVLSGVSFTLNRGDKLSIVGINGSGKSTIIKIMLGLYEIDSGQILINGYPMSDYDIGDVRKLFSVLFQNFVQFPLTLRENIAFSDLEQIKNDAKIKSVLKLSNVYDELQTKLEKKIDSYMTRQFDDNGTELSKGQWQKVALSRAYFKDAPIIIFDEPSAALDAEAEDKIFGNFEEISVSKTGIMISHRISSARISNKIIVLDGGKIIEQGTHDELVSLGGLYARLFYLQREKYMVKEGGENE